MAGLTVTEHSGKLTSCGRLGQFQPYYTTNAGVTWSPVTLPGVTSWSGFDWAYYLNAKTVTADRVLANTFYMCPALDKAYTEAQMGGANWTQTI